jgi:hypothetical protein
MCSRASCEEFTGCSRWENSSCKGYELEREWVLVEVSGLGRSWGNEHILGRGAGANR